MGVLITPTRIPFYIKSPEGDFPFLHGENFSGFFSKPFPGATAAATPTATTTAIITATLITITIAATAIDGTLTRVKAFPFRETF